MIALENRRARDASRSLCSTNLPSGWKSVTSRIGRPRWHHSTFRSQLPDLKDHFVNVVDLFKRVPHAEHAHGMTDREFEALPTSTKAVVFTRSF